MKGSSLPERDRLANFDGVADEEDVVQIEITDDIVEGKKLYVHINGATVLRIGKINPRNLHFTRSPA